MILAAAACASAPRPAQPAAIPDIADVPVYAVPSGSVWRDEGFGARHVASGISCPHRVGEFALIELRDNASAAIARDVVCGYGSVLGDYVAFHITQFDRLIDPQRYLDVSIAAIESTTDLTGDAPLPARSDGVPLAPRGAAFRTALRAQAKTDEAVHTALWVDAIGGWQIKLRATYAPSQAPLVAETVNELFLAAKTALPGGTL